jgi:ubiquinone/menaquinone biosynthesis C-methylase UbiE
MTAEGHDPGRATDPGRMSMRQGWEAEARSWASVARTPGVDHSHTEVNWPAFRDLLPGPGRRTLDMGCGEGRLSRLLRALGHRVVGIDASETMVRFAAGHQDAEPAVQADAAGLPFRDQEFDLVVAYMTLHDIDGMVDAVAEAARVLEPSGRLCLAIPHPINSAGEFPARDAAAPFVISGSYLDEHPAPWVFDRAGIRMTFHSEHRPLGSYAGALEAAGLLIEAIREVRPPESAAQQHAPQGRWRRIPLFLHLRAVKPG